MARPEHATVAHGASMQPDPHRFLIFGFPSLPSELRVGALSAKTWPSTSGHFFEYCPNLKLEPLEDQTQDGFRRPTHPRREPTALLEAQGLSVNVSLLLFRFQTWRLSR